MQFGDIVSHELQIPLRMVKSFAQILSRGTEASSIRQPMSSFGHSRMELGSRFASHCQWSGVSRDR